MSKHRDWLRQRLLRDGPLRCGRCGWQGECHFHRIIPGSQGGRYRADNIEVLCPNCHACAHGRGEANFPQGAVSITVFQEPAIEQVVRLKPTRRPRRTKKELRAMALAYYYGNREQILAKGREGRRLAKLALAQNFTSPGSG